MSQLVFDDEGARQIEASYLIADAARRRRIVREALGAGPGKRVLDVGCGPGFYCVELAGEVGLTGSVVGVDSSHAMLALAARRCPDRAKVTLQQGDALALPVPEAEFDGAVCVQVLEYVADLQAALAQLYGALRPGGRLVAWDIDWATVSSHALDTQRADRVWQTWDEHLAHRSLPRTLAPLLREIGFTDVDMQAHAFTTARYDPDSYGTAILAIVERFVAGRHGVDAGEAQAWLAEQRELGQRERFYFSCTQFCFTATKPQ